jgi:hypothetical protein
MSSAIKIRENFMMKEVLKQFNKELLEEEEVEISSLKCSVVAVEAELEVHRKVKMSNMPSKLPSKRFTKEKLPKLLSIEIESAQIAMVKEEKVELMPHVLLVKVEVW